MKINIFILAAGFGTRLRPISHWLPKPLLPILGKPLLHYILERVSCLEFNRIGINVHYMRSEMEKWLTECPFSRYLEIFPEEELLGTGGGLKNAKVFLDKMPFLVHNADILSDIDLYELVEQHINSGNLVTLAVHHFERFNHLYVDKKGFLKGVGTKVIDTYPDLKPMAFTGISVYQPEIIDFLPEGISSIVAGWLKAIESGHRVGTVDVTGCHWNDLGTPETYIDSVIDKLREKGETLYIHPSTQIKGPIQMDGMVSIEENCVLNKGAFLKNCLIMPRTEVLENVSFDNCIWTGEAQHPLNRKQKCLSEYKDLAQNRGILEMLQKVFGPGSTNPKTTLIGAGGSDRLYYRLTDSRKSAVLMVCKADDRDFERHLALTECLTNIAVPAARVFAADTAQKMALFEDLGDLSLYSKLKFTHSTQEIEDIYKSALDIAIRLHTEGIEQIKKYPYIQQRLFDYEHARWETDYFMERFVGYLCKVQVNDKAELENEFHHLALTIDNLPKTVIHRDFQSQNIMVKPGNALGIVDYQGARIGPPVYDVVSLLWDPYADIQEDSRKRLLDYYIARCRETMGRNFHEEQFRNSLLTARLQRHMQALGAYSFLALVKGKRYFLKHIPSALSFLKEEITLAKDKYPALYKLVTEIVNTQL